MKYLLAFLLMTLSAPAFAQFGSRLDEFPISFSGDDAEEEAATSDEETEEAEADYPQEVDFDTYVGSDDATTDDASHITSMNF